MLVQADVMPIDVPGPEGRPGFCMPRTMATSTGNESPPCATNQTGIAGSARRMAAKADSTSELGNDDDEARAL